MTVPPDAILSAGARLLPLTLRLRERGRTLTRSPIDAFLPSRYGEESTAAAYRGRRDRRATPGQLILDEIEGISVRLSRARQGPVIRIGSDPVLPIFFATSEFGIPQVDADLGGTDVGRWNLRHEERGYLALAALDAAGLPVARRGLTLVAALLPLTLLANPALAAPGSGGAPPLRSQPTSASREPSTASPEAGRAEIDADVAGTDAPLQPTDVTPASAAGTDTASDSRDGALSPVSPADPRPGNGAGAWSALVGSDVHLTLDDGAVLAGRLLAVQGTTLLVARDGDGLVVAVERTRIEQANVIVPEAGRRGDRSPHLPGTGLTIVGAVLTGVAGALLLGGIAGGVYCAAFLTTDGSSSDSFGSNSCLYYWVPTVVPAVVLASVGIPMLVVGKRKRDRSKQEVGVAQLAPRVTHTRGGWTGGLTLRF